MIHSKAKFLPSCEPVIQAKCFQNTMLRQAYRDIPFCKREIRKGNGSKAYPKQPLLRFKKNPFGLNALPSGPTGVATLSSWLGVVAPSAQPWAAVLFLRHWLIAGSTKTKETALPPRLVFCGLVAGVAAVLISESRFLSFSCFLDG